MEWYPEATVLLGPASKFGGYSVGDSGPKRGEIKHSMAGSFPGAVSVLNNPEKPSSWHFSVLKDGRVYQHYPLSAHTWHGNDSDLDEAVRANIDLIGVEHEGGGPGNESEPLTDSQLQASIKLTRWAAAQYNFSKFARFPVQQEVWTLVEHNQVGNQPTECPSNRIPWNTILAELEDQVALTASNPLWAEWRDRPQNIPYRSYLLWIMSDGSWKKTHVTSAEQHNALTTTGIAGDRPKPLSIWTLKMFPGKPEPDEP